MFMSFLNSVPLPIWVLLGFAILGFCDCLRELYTWVSKIEMFRDYKQRLVIFHNNAVENNNFDHESGDYLLENALKIYMDSMVHYKIYHPITGLTTGFMDEINDIVTFNCDDFTETCRANINSLTMTIGFLENTTQEIRSKIINPIHLVKKGVSLIFNSIPIVNLIPTKFKDFLCNLFVFISIVETLLSLFSQKLLIEQIIEWISQLPIF